MATFYGSLDKLEAFHSARGAPKEWTDATADQKTLGALAASEYLDRKYRFIGRRAAPAAQQVRAWPRYSAYDRDGYLVEGVPTLIEDAVAILTLEWLKGATFFQRIDAGASTGKTERESIQVGPIRLSTEYAEGTGGGSTFDRFPMVDAMLGQAGLLDDGSMRERG